MGCQIVAWHACSEAVGGAAQRVACAGQDRIAVAEAGDLDVDRRQSLQGLDRLVSRDVEWTEDRLPSEGSGVVPGQEDAVVGEMDGDAARGVSGQWVRRFTVARRGVGRSAA